MDRSGLPALFVGNELPDNTALCTDFDNCDAWGANDGSGYHSCDGVLGRAHADGENHLIILACRGNMARADIPRRRASSGPTGKPTPRYIDESDAEIARFRSLDAAGRESTWAGYRRTRSCRSWTTPG